MTRLFPRTVPQGLSFVRSESIVLGSSSPRRKQIFEFLDLQFEIKKPDFDEDKVWQERGPKNESQARQCLKKVTLGKLKEIVKDTSKQVFCFDTIVLTSKGKMLGKPKSLQEAKSMLALLDGERQKVITGCVCGNLRDTYYEEFTSVVRFKDLGPKRIADYIRSENVLDAAGAYKIQGKGLSLIQSIRGSYHNVMGLPIEFMNLFMYEEQQ